MKRSDAIDKMFTDSIEHQQTNWDEDHAVALPALDALLAMVFTSDEKKTYIPSRAIALIDLLGDIRKDHRERLSRGESGAEIRTVEAMYSSLLNGVKPCHRPAGRK